MALEPPTIDQVQAEAERHLQKIEKLFKSHCRLTLLMRNPESNDGDMLLSRDDISKVIESIKRLSGL